MEMRMDMIYAMNLYFYFYFFLSNNEMNGHGSERQDHFQRFERLSLFF